MHLAIGRWPNSEQLSSASGCLLLYNELAVPLTSVIRNACRAKRAHAKASNKAVALHSLDIRTWTLRGRCAIDLCHWARKRVFPGGITVTLPDRKLASMSEAATALANAGGTVRRGLTHAKVATIRFGDEQQITVVGSQNMEDLVHASLEYALVVPGNPDGLRMYFPGGCLARYILHEGWSDVRIVSYGVSQDQLDMLAASLRSVAVWRNMPRMRSWNALKVPNGVRLGLAPVHGKWACGTSRLSGQRCGILTSASLTRNRGEEYIMPMHPSIVPAMDSLAKALAGDQGGRIRTRLELDRFLARFQQMEGMNQ